MLIVLTSCTPTTNTTTTAQPDNPTPPPNNPTRLATLIKDSNLTTISGLDVTADNSDPNNPKITIAGLTNSASEVFLTIINIDQSKGITTDPASFVVSAEQSISPHTVTTPLKVTFEGEAAVSYTVTTKIQGTAVKDWLTTEKVGDYISVSFASQTPALSLTDSTLSITGLTDTPTGAGGMITFEKLPDGFTAAPSSFAFPNPDGDVGADITLSPNIFTITETDNTSNAKAYNIATIKLNPLTRFTAGIHIKFKKGNADVDGLSIREEANNVIRISGLTNEPSTDNVYTLTIEQQSQYFTTPGGTTITRTITEPTATSPVSSDFSPGSGVITGGSKTFQITSKDDNVLTTYTLEVDFSGAAVNDWFTPTDLRKYIIHSTFAGQDANRFTLENNTISIGHFASADNFTNVPNGAVSLRTLVPSGYILTGDDTLTDPDGAGLAAVTTASPGNTITITEMNRDTNMMSFPINITLAVYKSPLTPANITAMYGGSSKDTAFLSDKTIDTNIITISGFTNKAGALESGTVTVPTVADYTITTEPSTLSINDPNENGAITTNIGNIIVSKSSGDGTELERVSHPVTIVFSAVIGLRISNEHINNGNPLMNVATATEITVANTAKCKLLGTVTVSVEGIDGSKVAEATPFPRYYDSDRDTSNNNKFTVTRRLILVEADEMTEIARGFEIRLKYPACTDFADNANGMTEMTPYKIDNAPRLALASRLVREANTVYGNRFYKITANIDMGVADLPFSERGSMTPDSTGATGKGFHPIGLFDVNSQFKGTLDCDSKTISGLYINRPSENIIGLVGYANNAKVKNCVLTDVKIRGNNSVGALVGANIGAAAQVSDSYATGSVSGNRIVGGLVGLNSNSAQVSNSYATGSVSGEIAVGGLVGGNTFFAQVSNSYATGSITGWNYVGGLVGENADTARVVNSYATGTVTGTNNYVGGLVGFNDRATSSASMISIFHSYAIGAVTGNNFVGLFIGVNGILKTDGSIMSDSGGVRISYYNNGSTLTVNGSEVTVIADKKGVGSDTSSVMTDNSVVGKTTAQLQVTKGTDGVYTDWNNTVWRFTAGQYPRLRTVVCANRQYNQDATECTDL